MASPRSGNRRNSVHQTVAMGAARHRDCAPPRSVGNYLPQPRCDLGVAASFWRALPGLVAPLGTAIPSRQQRRTDRPGESRGKPISPEAKCGSDEDGLRFPHAILRLLIEAARVQASSSSCSPFALSGGGSGLFQPCCAACRSHRGAFADLPSAPQTIFLESSGVSPKPTWMVRFPI